MATIDWTGPGQLPVVDEADVVVIGGGPGGLGAAVMAAREGAQVLLIERYAALGGMASFGEVHPFMPNHLHGACLDRPVYAEWSQRIGQYQPALAKSDDPEMLSGPSRHISKEAAMLAAEDLCLDAGVRLLYHHQLVDAIVSSGRVEAVVLASKSGLSAVRGAVFVDATGDGDLAARAGCEFEQGGPSGYCQPMTLCFKLAGVDRSAMPPHAEINRLYDQARDEKVLDCPRENVLHFRWLTDDVVHFNTTRVLRLSATDGIELSEAEMVGRRQLRQFLAFFRERVPGFAHARIHSVAHHIGVRESRRVRGLAYVTREDFVACRKYPDGIARVTYGIDIHSPDGSGTEHLELPDGDWYEIPFGALVAKDSVNLLIAGRPISVDHAVHSSMRVMPPACTLGQAAGLAAAWAARDGAGTHELDGVAIRRRLTERGANLAPSRTTEGVGDEH